MEALFVELRSLRIDALRRKESATMRLIELAEMSLSEERRILEETRAELQSLSQAVELPA